MGIFSRNKTDEEEKYATYQVSGSVQVCGGWSDKDNWTLQDVIHATETIEANTTREAKVIFTNLLQRKADKVLSKYGRTNYKILEINIEFLKRNNGEDIVSPDDSLSSNPAIRWDEASQLLARKMSEAEEWIGTGIIDDMQGQWLTRQLEGYQDEVMTLEAAMQEAKFPSTEDRARKNLERLCRDIKALNIDCVKQLELEA